METQQTSAKSEPLWPLLFLFGGVLSVVVAVGGSLFFMLGTWEHRGQFGDMFGLANALFSGMAFGALTYTMFLQRKELALQRLELALTRAELAKQSEAQNKHAATALKAARIGALGSLLQGYATLYSANRHGLIGAEPVEHYRRVQEELRTLLDESGA